MTKRIPINRAREISRDYGYDQVVIFARRVGDDGHSWVTTYGKNRAHCDVAARIGKRFGELEDGKYTLVPTDVA